jgi:hypothetical protein
MPDRPIDPTFLGEFEQGLNVRWPERSRIPARVLGYGEISTVLEIQSARAEGLAYKRMPMFRDEGEATRYAALYHEYVAVLHDQIGVTVVPGELARLHNQHGRLIVYVAQEKLPPESIGHRAIRQLRDDEARRLIRAVLQETRKVFDFNRAHAGELEVGLDGQISNWVIIGLDAAARQLPGEIRLAYLDTSTPLMRKGGQEQLDAELFLRSAPFFLVWLLRLLYLEEVLTRYYDLHRVILDLVANFYKEQRGDLIPALIDLVNESFAAEIQGGAFKPLTAQEVASYYKQDAQLWSVYLAARKVDRFLHRLFGKEYPYILPEKVVR